MKLPNQNELIVPYGVRSIKIINKSNAPLFIWENTSDKSIIPDVELKPSGSYIFLTGPEEHKLYFESLEEIKYDCISDN